MKARQSRQRVKGITSITRLLQIKCANSCPARAPKGKWTEAKFYACKLPEGLKIWKTKKFIEGINNKTIKMQKTKLVLDEGELCGQGKLCRCLMVPMQLLPALSQSSNSPYWRRWSRLMHSHADRICLAKSVTTPNQSIAILKAKQAWTQSCSSMTWVTQSSVSQPCLVFCRRPMTVPQDEKEKPWRIPGDHGGLNGVLLSLNLCTHAAPLTKQLIQVMESFHVASLANVLL